MASYTRSSNPFFSSKTIGRFGQKEITGKMTLQGTVNKSALLILLVLIAASWTWRLFFTNPLAVYHWLIIGTVAGVILGLIAVFMQSWSPYLAPFYALSEGLIIGGLSASVEVYFPGIVLQAVSLTFGAMIILLLAYKSGTVRATEKFKTGVITATGAIALIYLITFVLSFFGIPFSYIHSNGWIGIGFSVFVVMIASFNLVLDFDAIENAINEGSPKYMEWYCAFGLMVTLIWLYIEVLNLLAKLRSNK